MGRIFSANLLVACFIFLFADLTASGMGQDSIRVNETVVNYRHPSKEKMEAYKLMEIYDYNETVHNENWWARLLRWFTEQFNGVGLNPKVAIYSLSVLGVILIVYYLLRMYGFSPIEFLLFKQNKEVGELQFSKNADDLYRQDLNELLDTCIRNNAYREAVRILYLSIVKSMDKTGLIVWQPWKTDRDYCYEISDREMALRFKKLVRSYEYIWYGQFAVVEDEFYAVKSEFDGFSSFVSNNNVKS